MILGTYGINIMNNYILTAATVFVFTALTYFSSANENVLDLPITEPGDIISESGVLIDEGNGNALRIDAKEKTEIELFDIDGKDYGNTKLVYRADMRSQDLTAIEGSKGIAYLQMTVLFPGGEELIARGPRVPISGTTDWRPGETVLYVDKGAAPESVKLGVIVDGAGKIWIEDVKLYSRPLRTDYLLWGHVVVWIVLIIYIYHLLRKQARLSRELKSLRG